MYSLRRLASCLANDLNQKGEIQKRRILITALRINNAMRKTSNTDMYPIYVKGSNQYLSFSQFALRFSSKCIVTNY